MARKYQVSPGDIVHVFNRGVEKRKTFLTNTDRKRFTELLSYCNNYSYPYSTYLHQLQQTKTNESTRQLKMMLDMFQKYDQPLCSIVAYVLMPNHFHLLLQEENDGGMAKFMQKLQNAYTKYFNTKQNRVGSLFQGKYKFVPVENDQQLLHVSRYIHLNPTVKNIVPIDDLEKYKWSSYPAYSNWQSQKNSICNFNIVREHFKTKSSFQAFTTAPMREGEPAQILENLTIDDDFAWY